MRHQHLGSTHLGLLVRFLSEKQSTLQLVKNIMFNQDALDHDEGQKSAASGHLSAGFFKFSLLICVLFSRFSA